MSFECGSNQKNDANKADSTAKPTPPTVSINETVPVFNIKPDTNILIANDSTHIITLKDTAAPRLQSDIINWHISTPDSTRPWLSTISINLKNSLFYLSRNVNNSIELKLQSDTSSYWVLHWKSPITDNSASCWISTSYNPSVYLNYAINPKTGAVTFALNQNPPKTWPIYNNGFNGISIK